MKKLFSYLITLIIGLICGICCHNKVENTLTELIDDHFEKKRKKNMRRPFSYAYGARPWNYNPEPIIRVNDNYKDIWFVEEEDAEKVLLLMKEKTNNDVVTIADLKTFAGLKSSWLDTKYGWTDLDCAIVYQDRYNEKYYLDLPDPFPIAD